jgi:hypothetical protein
VAWRNRRATILRLLAPLILLLLALIIDQALQANNRCARMCAHSRGFVCWLDEIIQRGEEQDHQALSALFMWG